MRRTVILTLDEDYQTMDDVMVINGVIEGFKGGRDRCIEYLQKQDSHGQFNVLGMQPMERNAG